MFRLKGIRLKTEGDMVLIARRPHPVRLKPINEKRRNFLIVSCPRNLYNTLSNYSPNRNRNAPVRGERQG